MRAAPEYRRVERLRDVLVVGEVAAAAVRSPVGENLRLVDVQAVRGRDVPVRVDDHRCLLLPVCPRSEDRASCGTNADRGPGAAPVTTRRVATVRRIVSTVRVVKYDRENRRFCHILPPAFYDRMTAISDPRRVHAEARARDPGDSRSRRALSVMDQFGDYRAGPQPRDTAHRGVGRPDGTPELARMANDGMAEIVARHPDRFPGFIASLPMNNPEAALHEIERALTDLGATGIKVYTNVERPCRSTTRVPAALRADGPRATCPIWLHPTRTAAFSDYATEPKCRLEMWWVFGWPYETSVAMARIVFAGYFDRFPDLKIITHHMGGMIPYFAGRIGPGSTSSARAPTTRT